MLLIVYIIAAAIGWQINGFLGMLAALVIAWIVSIAISAMLMHYITKPDSKIDSWREDR